MNLASNLLLIVLLLNFLSGESGNLALMALDEARGERLAILIIELFILSDVTVGLPERPREENVFNSSTLFIVATTVE